MPVGGWWQFNKAASGVCFLHTSWCSRLLQAVPSLAFLLLPPRPVLCKFFHPASWSALLPQSTVCIPTIAFVQTAKPPLQTPVSSAAPSFVSAILSSSRAHSFLQKAFWKASSHLGGSLPAPRTCPWPRAPCTAGHLLGHLLLSVLRPVLLTLNPYGLSQVLQTWVHNHYLFLLVKILKQSSLMSKNKQG